MKTDSSSPGWRLAFAGCTRASPIFIIISAFFASMVNYRGAAQTVFEQPPDPGIFAGSSSTLDFFGRTPSRRTADDFVVTAGSLIHEIDWWGQHAPPSSGLDDFTFSFYADAAGLPGSLLLQTRGRVLSMPDAAIPGLTAYQAILDVPFGAQAGVTYWFSVFNASPNAAWRWNNSIIGNEISVQSVVPPDNEWFHVGGSNIDASFRLVAVPDFDRLCPCAGPASGGKWKNHGDYVSCVSRAAETALDDGLLTESAKDVVVQKAARSDCGKK